MLGKKVVSSGIALMILSKSYCFVLRDHRINKGLRSEGDGLVPDVNELIVRSKDNLSKKEVKELKDRRTNSRAHKFSC